MLVIAKLKTIRPYFFYIFQSSFILLFVSYFAFAKGMDQDEIHSRTQTVRVALASYDQEAMKKKNNNNRHINDTKPDIHETITKWDTTFY